MPRYSRDYYMRYIAGDHDRFAQAGHPMPFRGDPRHLWRGTARAWLIARGDTVRLVAR